MTRWIKRLFQLMQNIMGIREVKSIEFFKETFSISIILQITHSGYQEDEIFHVGLTDCHDEGIF